MKTRNVIAFGIIVAAVLIGMTFMLSSSASAAVVTPGAAVVKPAVNSAVIAPRLAPRPFIASRPFIAPRPFVRPFPFFFPKVNPFFFDVDVDPFFFNGEVGFEGFAAD